MLTPHLQAALRRANAKRCAMVVSGLPACIAASLPRHEAGDAASAYAAACEACALKPRCPGIDPVYLDLYGDGELCPFEHDHGAGRDTGAATAKELPFVGGLGRPTAP